MMLPHLFQLQILLMEEKNGELGSIQSGIKENVEAAGLMLLLKLYQTDLLFIQKVKLTKYSQLRIYLLVTKNNGVVMGALAQIHGNI